MKKEIEIKIKLDKKDKISEKLKVLGGRKTKDYSQTTYGFFSDNSREKGIFPRIRTEQGKTIFTVKVRKEENTGYFERDEYSFPISSVKKGIEMLSVLGFNKVRLFKKRRQEWFLKGCKVNICVDDLYFGKFLEIEGEKEKIESMIKALGFEGRERITRTYLGLEDDWKREHSA